jgi:hypothetical protein
VNSTLIAALALLSAPANASFFTYSEWPTWPLERQAAYIAGMYDGITSVAYEPLSRRYALHLHSCMLRSKMNNAQIAQNLRIFVSTRPSLQSGNVPTALVQYFHEACAPVPDDTAQGH